jgi:hypothetical protein
LLKDAAFMDNISIRFCDEAHSDRCPLCDAQVVHRPGPRLFLRDSEHAVCRECGKGTSPRLLELLDLASVAEKVGQRCRPLLTPPMEALLELARAAENYSHLSPRVRARAG